jgi:modulator of FtsH protease
MNTQIDNYSQNPIGEHQQSQAAQLAVERYKVLKNTYSLLSMTLLFCAFCAWIAIELAVKPLGFIITLLGYFGLLFATVKLRNSAWGLACVFALTGFMGFTLGPMVSVYWSAAPGVVMQAFASTALVFLSLSSYAVVTKKDFSFMGSFLMTGIIVAFVAGLAAIFFEISALSLAVSAIFVVLMSGLILYQTSEIVNGGETNYIMATVSLFVAIFNLFTSLLHLLGMGEGE